MASTKFYVLYNNKEQSKLLTTANSPEKLKNETEFYSEGFWFEYDRKEESNLIENEKEMKGIKFPKEPKSRDVKNGDFGGKSKTFLS